MSDVDDEDEDGEINLFDQSLDGADNMGFGPLVPTESERSLIERVKQELKHELKQVIKSCIYPTQGKNLCNGCNFDSILIQVSLIYEKH